MKTQEFEGAMHVANPNLEEQNRVWSDENNLERRRRNMKDFKFTKQLSIVKNN